MANRQLLAQVTYLRPVKCGEEIEVTAEVIQYGKRLGEWRSAVKILRVPTHPAVLAIYAVSIPLSVDPSLSFTMFRASYISGTQAFHQCPTILSVYPLELNNPVWFT